MSQRGGARPGCGRKPQDPAHRSTRLSCNLPPELWDELQKREAKTGVYHTQIAKAILSDALIGGVVRSFKDPM
jgi:hypothetical protein